MLKIFVKPSLLLIVLLCCVTSCGMHEESVHAIRTEKHLIVDGLNFKLTYDKVNSTFSLTNKKNNKTVVSHATLLKGESVAEKITKSHIIDVDDDKWGHGKAVEIRYTSGAVNRIALYHKLPFVLCHTVLANNSNKTIFFDKNNYFNSVVLEGKQAKKLRAFGTASLTPVDGHTGSYNYLAIVEPKTRHGVVAGWLSQDRGSGVLFSKIKNNKAVLESRIDHGTVHIKPNNSVNLDTFIIGYFDDARKGLEAYADAIAKQYEIKIRGDSPTFYMTWYNSWASDEVALAKDARFIHKYLQPYGLSLVQIDDNWQAGLKHKKNMLSGPRKNFNRHREEGPYKNGMKKPAEHLKSLGLTAGLWYIPFGGTWDDPYFKNKQDLFAKNKEGKTCVVRWGGSCFDLTKPKTLDYVKTVADRITNKWGYQFIKTDGLWTGIATQNLSVSAAYKEDDLGASVLDDSEKTHVEAYRDGLKAIRQATNEDVYILGCTTSQNMRTLGASFGLVDAMRTGPDNFAAKNWKFILMTATYGSRFHFLHNRVWHNDPDSFSIKDSLPLNEAQLMAAWVAMSGQLNSTSVDYSTLSKERLHLLQRTIPAHPLNAQVIDLFESKIPRIWTLTDTRSSTRRDVIALYNWDRKKEKTISYPLHKMGYSKSISYVAFDFWANRFHDPFSKTVNEKLPPKSCRILAIRPVSNNPQLLSTSRHVTQGIVDVVDEQWEAQNNTLKGVSEVVGTDPYELRIAAMHNKGKWVAKSVSVSEQDKKAGVTIELKKQDGWKVRVLIKSKDNRVVKWKVSFEN